MYVLRRLLLDYIMYNLPRKTYLSHDTDECCQKQRYLVPHYHLNSLLKVVMVHRQRLQNPGFGVSSTTSVIGVHLLCYIFW